MVFVVIGIYQKVSFTRTVFVVIGVLPEGLFHYNGVCSDWGLTRRSLSL